MVSTHSRPKAAGGTHQWRWLLHYVSTHSRPKAAGDELHPRPAGVQGFNTQPPEGGWTPSPTPSYPTYGFNTQPPEGGWSSSARARWQKPSFNTQPPEGGWQGPPQSV